MISRKTDRTESKIVAQDKYLRGRSVFETSGGPLTIDTAFAVYLIGSRGDTPRPLNYFYVASRVRILKTSADDEILKYDGKPEKGQKPQYIGYGG